MALLDEIRHCLDIHLVVTGESVQDVAVACGMHYTRLYHFRAGRQGLRAETLERLCGHLGVEVEVCHGLLDDDSASTGG